MQSYCPQNMQPAKAVSKQDRLQIVIKNMFWYNKVLCRAVMCIILAQPANLSSTLHVYLSYQYILKDDYTLDHVRLSQQKTNIQGILFSHSRVSCDMCDSNAVLIPSCFLWYVWQ